MTLFKLLEMNMFGKFLLIISVLLVTVFFFREMNLASAATLGNDDDEYTRAITARSEKIVNKLSLDEPKHSKVLKIIIKQYRDLNDIDADYSDKRAAIGQNADNNQREYLMDQLDVVSEKKREKIHHRYLRKLNRHLTESQVEKVKDEMTYNVLPITYKNYLDMLPKLTAEQQRQILDYLTEAREKAMDAGSAKEKHAWFGKYKGKINNYLSAEGVETKKAREEWEKKLKER
ncbi:DUF3826 domain-containing protein [Olivibacter sp. SDN3]|uniref:DUF3826 domain-containing protein n=1 Tax=Olivibacter sp. SDN3 TaxID=2764720 RepID=UPI0016515768|nr:DUF3826 domain-containing protein [Olivibacter sp. SDN3]QNL52249.1 DUF3826 domain-containing protein [Olivibacter sp. SDN3]